MKVPNFLRKKRNIIIIVVVLVILAALFLIFREKKNPGSIQLGAVTKQDLQETVLSTGQVVSGTDLNLSFQSSGVVKQVLVKEGDKVYRGQLLALLDSASASASLLTAQGALAQAEANYEKLVAGASLENIGSNSSIVASKKIALDNANQNALNGVSDANTKAYSALSAATDLQNTYFVGYDGNARNAKTQIEGAVEVMNVALGKARASLLQADIDNAVSMTVSSLSTISSALAVIRSTLDEQYYYGRIPDTQRQVIDAQRTAVNTSLSAVTGLQFALSNAKISLLQSGPEVDLAKAQILSAQGQVASARALVNNSIIAAPANGTITQVDIKVGEQASALKEVIILQDTGDLHTEADVSEANIASLQIGQAVDYTFDALGPDQHFVGKVLTINPASTVVSGVVNYKVTASIENIPEVKPGMTANMTIMVAKKQGALAVPSTAIVNKNNKNYVRIVDDISDKKYHEVEVKTGLQADGGLVEIITGLSDGQQIVTYIK